MTFVPFYWSYVIISTTPKMTAVSFIGAMSSIYVQSFKGPSYKVCWKLENWSCTCYFIHKTEFHFSRFMSESLKVGRDSEPIPLCKIFFSVCACFPVDRCTSHTTPQVFAMDPDRRIYIWSLIKLGPGRVAFIMPCFTKYSLRWRQSVSNIHQRLWRSCLYWSVYPVRKPQTLCSLDILLNCI